MRLRLLSLLFLPFVLVACDSNDPDSIGGADADDINVRSVTESSDGSILTYEVNVRNDGDDRYDAVTVDFRLLSGSTIVDDGSAIYTSGIGSDQSQTEDALFFDLDSFDDVECYEYDIQVVRTGDNGGVSKKSYDGTC